MPPGFYGISYAESPIDFIFVKTEITQDDFIPMEGYIVKDVINDIDTFWSCSKNFEKYGFIHKRGILLFGPAGGGKTVAVQEICKRVIEKGGIVFSFTSSNVECNVFGRALTRFRIVEPDRPVVCIFEDIDSIIDKYGESELLQLLDGGIQIDKVLMLGTTNYPERLDKRIISRPRRFDRVTFIDNPPEFARRRFFEGKLKGVSDEIIDMYVEATDGLSFAALSELIVSVHCLGNDFKLSVELLKDLMKNSHNSINFKKLHVGFEKQ
jgi:SpoVK/Ycf46/Vps4 family AAA+-type ATPase